MTAPDEGKAAIEAAVDACWTDHQESITLHARMQDAIRAYLKALPGWRMVPVEISKHGGAGVSAHALIVRPDEKWPPPPGLEPGSHD